jgi:hypothetical protein
MTTAGKATFAMKTWDEKPYAEIDGERKLTRTHATFAYEGDIEGEGTVDYLMSYCPNGVGNFVGLERIVGRVGSRSGSFVAQHTGTFEPKSVTTQWQIVPGSGTGELEGLGGGGEFVLAGHGPYLVTFDYHFK